MKFDHHFGLSYNEKSEREREGGNFIWFVQYPFFNKQNRIAEPLNHVILLVENSYFHDLCIMVEAKPTAHRMCQSPVQAQVRNKILGNVTFNFTNAMFAQMLGIDLGWPVLVQVDPALFYTLGRTGIVSWIFDISLVFFYVKSLRNCQSYSQT